MLLTTAGQKLRALREQLGFTIREVEAASQRIAAKHQNDDFSVPLSRLSDIETKGVIPSIFRLYSFSIIYRRDMRELISWYGVDVNQTAGDLSAERASAFASFRGAGKRHGDLSADGNRSRLRCQTDDEHGPHDPALGARAALAPGPTAARALCLRIHRQRGSHHVPAAAAGRVCASRRVAQQSAGGPVALRIRAADLLCRDARRVCVCVVRGGGRFADSATASALARASALLQAAERGGNPGTGGWDCYAAR